MTEIVWKEKAIDFLRKLDKKDSERIVKKIDSIKENTWRYIETLVAVNFNKIRVGDWRLFVDYSQKEDKLVIHVIEHRKKVYKKLK